MKTIVCFLFVLGALSAEGDVFVSKAGGKAILECGLNPYQKYLIWYQITNDNKEHKIVSYDKSGFPRKGSAAIKDRSKVTRNNGLEISQVVQADAGRFLCNADGAKSTHTLVVVSVSTSGNFQVGSTATLHCQVTPKDKDSTVQWKKPGGASHPGPEIQLNPVTTSDGGTWQCMFTYGGSTLSENLTISIQESAPERLTTPPNSKNSPKSGCAHCPQPGITDQENRNDFQLLELSWWVWLSIGIGCLVVILLIVLVVILCKRIRRRKRRLQVMKNAQHLMRTKTYCKCDRPAASPKQQHGHQREKPSALPLKTRQWSDMKGRTKKGEMEEKQRMK